MAAVLLVAALVVGLRHRPRPGHHPGRLPGPRPRYSLWLKHQAILDILAVAAGFVLRAVAGATATAPAHLRVVLHRDQLRRPAGGGGQARERAARPRRPTPGRCGPPWPSTPPSSCATCAAWPPASCWWPTACGPSSRPPGSDAGAVWFQLSIVPFTAAVFQYAPDPRAGRWRAPRAGADHRSGHPGLGRGLGHRVRLCRLPHLTRGPTGPADAGPPTGAARLGPHQPQRRPRGPTHVARRAGRARSTPADARGAIARGLGRSYGDAAQNAGGSGHRHHRGARLRPRPGHRRGAGRGRRQPRRPAARPGAAAAGSCRSPRAPAT